MSEAPVPSPPETPGLDPVETRLRAHTARVTPNSPSTVRRCCGIYATLDTPKGSGALIPFCSGHPQTGKSTILSGSGETRCASTFSCLMKHGVPRHPVLRHSAAFSCLNPHLPVVPTLAAHKRRQQHGTCFRQRYRVSEGLFVHTPLSLTHMTHKPLTSHSQATHSHSQATQLDSQATQLDSHDRFVASFRVPILVVDALNRCVDGELELGDVTAGGARWVGDLLRDG